MQLGEKMSETPELRQVHEARRALASHTALPRSYWVVHGVGLVVLAGVPLWVSLIPAGAPFVSWGLLLIAAAAAGHSVLRRRRSGVRLPRRITAYPSAVVPWFVVLAVSLAGLLAIHLLVGAGYLGPAVGALGVVAVAMLLGHLHIHGRVRADIAAGRVTP